MKTVYKQSKGRHENVSRTSSKKCRRLLNDDMEDDNGKGGIFCRLYIELVGLFVDRYSRALFLSEGKKDVSGKG